MPYTVLYRQKRPRTFAELVGQPHVVRTLKNQLLSGHIPHAYLFCGTRGTGKTTAARILARAVNCENLQDGEPCNACAVCESILQERNLSVTEIDAASNNGVENIRDLREQVVYPPTEGRYRVYIIDEAHMLTGSAFNALLKTLEEPPSHVLFILATTDPQKVPPTILSRCQRYDFKRITTDDLTATMRRYLEQDSVPAQDEALRYIASVSDGALRDALSVLDQCLSFYAGETLTQNKVLELLGAVDRRVLFDFADALAAFDSPRLMAVIAEAVKNGRDIRQFADDLARHFRDLMVAKTNADLLDCTREAAESLRAQADALDGETIILYIRAFSELLNDLRYAPHPRFALEVCAIRLCHPDIIREPEALTARVARLERRLEEAAGALSAPRSSANAEPIAPSVPASRAPESSPPIQPPPSSAGRNPPASRTPELSVPNQAPPSADLTPPVAGGMDIARLQKDWPAFCATFAPPLKSLLPRCGTDSARGTLTILCDNAAARDTVDKRKAQIAEKIAARYGLPQPPVLAIEIREGYNAPISAPAFEDFSALGQQVDLEEGW